MIILAADHGGFNLKEEIKQYLKSKSVEFIDMGNIKLDPGDDYPDFIVPAIKELKKDIKNNKLIVACRSGSGEIILANKFSGVRATVSWNSQHAKMARIDNDSNTLALPSDYVDTKQALEIVETWLETSFSNAERHVRRLQKIANIEKELEKEQVTGII